MYKWCHESRRNYTFVKLKATKISKRCVLFWSRGPDGYRKNDRKRAVVWPWLVLELSKVLALTQLGIRQSDWRRVGIRSTNLHIVVEYRNWPRYGLRWSGWYCHQAQHELCRPSRGRLRPRRPVWRSQPSPVLGMPPSHCACALLNYLHSKYFHFIG